ncbi:MAG: Unknown protein [uncultured Sulfurovum sp.]|uniref:Uncharacterized protein n=1 Tax=uncultured Sulfurovum sp. TaxID=269237 RepID=A0A6S6TS72_9BACT|nr:MAG: Unknown protein [uncultured Sulfurovum sp.]
MNWFESKKYKKTYPTKFFVNYLPETSQTKENTTIQEKSLGATIVPMALDILLTLTPKLAEQSMNFVSQSLESLTIEKAFPTIVRRNFDVINEEHLSLPSKITLVRGDFTPKINTKGEVFGDGTQKRHNQVTLTGNKELHIEIDIIPSKDKSAVYFQASSYFYAGQSPEGHSIDEIVLAFAFLPAGQSMVTPQNEFTSFLHFEALNPKQQYNFKTANGYDSAFQSAWITKPFKEAIPYTMVIQIQEIRRGNSFAKLLQTIYVENERNIKSKLNTHITNTKERINEE